MMKQEPSYVCSDFTGGDIVSTPIRKQLYFIVKIATIYTIKIDDMNVYQINIVNY